MRIYVSQFSLSFSISQLPHSFLLFLPFHFLLQPLNFPKPFFHLVPNFQYLSTAFIVLYCVCSLSCNITLHELAGRWEIFVSKGGAVSGKCRVIHEKELREMYNLSGVLH